MKKSLYVMGLLCLMLLCVSCGVMRDSEITERREDEVFALEDWGTLLPEKEGEILLPEVGSKELFYLYEEAGGEWWKNEEDVTQFAWGQALNVWEAYITIYDATKDEIWLKKLSEEIDMCLAKRDIYTGKKDINGYSLPAWSNTSDSSIYEGYYFPVETGLILHPILRFVEMVRENEVSTYYEKADEYVQACIDALAIFDNDIGESTTNMVPKEACYNLWREEKGESGIHGYYVGHLYYAVDAFAAKGYVPDNTLPYNQSVALSQCYPILYRLTGEDIWKEKTEKSWNWFRDGIQKEGEIWWWYYSQYYNWCRKNRVLIWESKVPESKEDFYADYDGHYSVELMFLIEAHRSGIICDADLIEIGRNKKEMGLAENGWAYVMNDDTIHESNNLKAAVYFDYFVNTLDDYGYIEMVFPVLNEEICRQYERGELAAMSTKVNGTCLRLLASAVSSRSRID